MPADDEEHVGRIVVLRYDYLPRVEPANSHRSGRALPLVGSLKTLTTLSVSAVTFMGGHV